MHRRAVGFDRKAGHKTESDSSAASHPLRPCRRCVSFRPPLEVPRRRLEAAAAERAVAIATYRQALSQCSKFDQSDVS